MKMFFNRKEVIYQLAIWGLIIVWYFVFGYQILYKADRALDDIIKSHSFWLLSEAPKEKDIITIVAIDQESRRRLNLKWPWPRSLTAKMIEKISACEPDVIGLDIVFSGKSEPAEDSALTAAFKSHPRIVAASMVQPDGIIRPSPQFENALRYTGFVNRPLEGGKVRSMIPVLQDADQPQMLPIELQLLQVYLETHSDESFTVSENKIAFPNQTSVKFKNGLLPINYLVYHRNFKTIPAYEVLENQINPLDFKNKIVLIGATDPIIHDEYDTALGIFPGVAIIANALVMFLSHRFITDLPLYQTVLLGLICCGFIYLTCRRTGLLVATLTLFMTLAGTFLFCIYLRWHDVRLSYLTLFFLQFITFLTFNLYHYISLIYVRTKLTRKVLFNPVTRLYAARYFKLLAEDKAERTGALVVVGIKIGNYERLRQQLTVEQIKHLIKNLTASLRKELFLTKNDAMATVSPGVIAIVQEKPKIEQTLSYLADVINEAEKKEWLPDHCRLRVSLTAVLLHKAQGIKIENGDPIGQLEEAFKKTSSNQTIHQEALNEINRGKPKSSVNVRNEYDFIVYDWEEKAKELGTSLRALSEANTRLGQLNINIIKTLARSIDAKSAWTAGHSERVTRLAVQIGERMGLDDHERNRLEKGGLLHDIGKIGIPNHILDKPGTLTDEEYQQICEHPGKGARIIEPLEQLREVMPLVQQHHERYDGQGYPLGLGGDDIDLCARIIAVADVFDALRSDRPYRSGMALNEVVDVIKSGSGTQFDPEVVSAFLEFISDLDTAHLAASKDFFIINSPHEPNAVLG